MTERLTVVWEADKHCTKCKGRGYRDDGTWRRTREGQEIREVRRVVCECVMARSVPE